MGVGVSALGNTPMDGDTALTRIADQLAQQQPGAAA